MTIIKLTTEIDAIHHDLARDFDSARARSRKRGRSFFTESGRNLRSRKVAKSIPTLT